MILPPPAPSGLLLAAVLLVIVALLGLGLWQSRNRAYVSSASVAEAYDRWTSDRLLERLWGEHVHLGHYGTPPRQRDFRRAKEDFVHELVHWSGLDQLAPGSTLLDVGCGIGGSARILARDYGFRVLAISISPGQIARARSLTPSDLACRFEVMDALALDCGDHSFDAVWSVEAGPHMEDKQRYADELLRVLKPDGVLAVADWNRRDLDVQPMTTIESWVMRQLLDQWAHPEFASIKSFTRALQSSSFLGTARVSNDDWSEATLPSWIDSIIEGLRRPGAVLSLGPGALIQGLRETPTLLLMHWAFASGLMQFGVFRTTPAAAENTQIEATTVSG